MGKRSRRQAPRPGQPRGADKHSLRQRADAASRVAERRIKQRPPAPWDPFPLTELAVLSGVLLVVIGIFVSGGAGRGMIVAGVVVACIGGLETAVREHFGGYRSHAGLLAGAVALAVLIGVTSLARLGPAPRAGLAVGVFAILFPVLRSSFIRKSGGRGVL